MTKKQELAYQRKAKLRKKHRKVRAELVSDMTNLHTAVRKSRKGKEGKKGVVIFDKDPEGNLLRLQQSLIDGTYHTSEGHDCMRRCPCGKIRKLHKLPYYPRPYRAALPDANPDALPGESPLHRERS